MRATTLSAILLVLLVARFTFAQPDAEKIVPPQLLTELLALNGDIETKAKPKYLSPNDIIASPDKTKLYVTEQTAKRVVRINIATKTIDKTIQLPNEPTGIAVSKNGEILYVTIASDRWTQGYVCVINAASGSVTARIATGKMSRSPVLDSAGKTLYVCNWFSHDVSVVDLLAGKEVARIPVTREPYSAAITPDGTTLVVTNSVPDQKATDTLGLACKIDLVNIATRTIRAHVPLHLGSHSLFGLCITADGKYALATHLLGGFTMPALDLKNGWVHSNNLAIVDIANGTLLNDVELDLPTRGYANPWGLGYTGDNNLLCITHMGSKTLSIIKLPELITLAKVGKDLSHTLSALNGIKNTLPLTAQSPRELVVIDNKVYITGYLADSLDVVTVPGLTGATIDHIGLGPKKPFNAERQGENNFSDASLCFQNWQTCFSCHPFTRPDALNWILNTTNSRQKNAKSMLYAWWTPPNLWAGKMPAAGGSNGSIRNGISGQLFTYSTEDVAVPLDTFFMWMRPVMNPNLDKGRLSASAQRGKAVFTKVGCIDCHPAPLYTNQKFRDGSVVDVWDPNKDWDVPSLIEVWRTSPYSHFGMYDKLIDIVKVRAHSLGAANLPATEFDDLISYVLSL